MKFLLYSLNYFPEMTGIGKYNEEMCTELVNNGNDVSVITAPPYYPQWAIEEGYSKVWYSKVFIKKVKVTR